MASNGAICQGFVYNQAQGKAFFKGSNASTPVDTSRLCLNPNSSAWLLAAGMPQHCHTALCAVHVQISTYIQLTDGLHRHNAPRVGPMGPMQCLDV